MSCSSMYGPGFPDALHVATELAALSPSSHNCQPWAYAWLTSSRARRSAAALLGGENDDEREYVALALDRRRELDALPAHAVEMRLSCGLYWEILLRGLAAQGWVLDRLRFTDTSADERALDDGWPAHWSLLSVAELRRAPRPEENLAELRTTVESRHTNRGPYREDGIDPVVLKGLDDPATVVAADAPIEIAHWRSEAERSRFVRFIARYGGRDFSHDAAWRETHGFLRWSASEAATRGDGFTLEHLFGRLSRPRGLFLRAALNPSLMRVLRFGGYHHVLAWQLATITRPTPAIVAMSFRDASPDTAAMVQAGARLADYWLNATREGLALHPISIVLQHDDVRHALQESFGLPGRTFFVSRVGRPAADFPASPNRPVACRMV